MGCTSTTRTSRPVKCNQIESSSISNGIKLRSIHDEFEFIKILGHGQYGSVREASRKSSQSTQKYAIKSITKQKLLKHEQVLKRELEIMSIVDHPNIIRLYETYEDELYLHLVLELCTGGDVCERIIEKGSLTESEAKIIMKQLLNAVSYLHNNHITHRDLKPENFLYINHSSEEVKLCDFGMSIRSSRTKMKSVAGTPYYLAPEVLNGPYTKACDIWSLGVFMYFILVGKHPFKGKNLDSIYEKSKIGITAPEVEKLLNTSTHAKDLLVKMINVNPNKRITAREALAHEWITATGSEQSQVPQTVLKSLIKYKAKNKLWQEAMKIVVKNLSNPQINSLKKAFITLDSTNSGFVTANDLQTAMKTHGFNLAFDEIESIIQNCSYLESGKIKYSDFLVATLNKKALMNEALIWEAFKIFDAKSTGKINTSDLAGALRRAGCDFTEQEFNELIAEARIDENSDIDFENFKVIMNCFEEDSEIHVGNGRRMSLMRRMSADFKEVIHKTQSLIKEKVG